jgi:D-amino peptidase
MKIYIMTDLEGISCILSPEQTGWSGKEYPTARLLLTEEINAVVDGALEGGAKEIIVNDGHGGGNNMLMDKAHPGATYVGCLKSGKRTFLTGFDESFDAVFLVGMHAMSGTQDGILNHTQNSTCWYNYYINGKKYGEIGQAAIIAGHYKVPVVYVTGDFAAVRETKELLGNDIEAVSVKTGYDRYKGKCISPIKARELVRAGAKRAIKKIGKIKPYILKPPLEVTLELTRTDYADDIDRFGRVKRIDSRTVRGTANSALDILRVMDG